MDLLKSVGATVSDRDSLLSVLCVWLNSLLLSAQVVECACIVELKALGGYQKLQAKHPEVKVVNFFASLACAVSYHPNPVVATVSRHYLQVWGLISEDVLTLEGTLL